MKLYLLSFGTGLLVGLVYALLHVRSPAPPVIALVGLLGILAGEQIIPLTQQLLSGTTKLSLAWRQAGCATHMFGRLPSCPKPSDTESAS
nr:XapX domain-containing protein [uncultured Acidocella sp.]